MSTLFLAPVSNFLTPSNIHITISPHVYVSICLFAPHSIINCTIQAIYITQSNAYFFHCCIIPSLISYFICNINICIYFTPPTYQSIFKPLLIPIIHHDPRNSFFLNLTNTFTRANTIIAASNGYIILVLILSPFL